MGNFVYLVNQELTRARELHSEPLHSPPEAYAVLLEELDEFWEEIRKKPFERSKKNMLEELVQLGAMCQRTAEDLGLI